jgi:glycine cleavage system H protein
MAYPANYRYTKQHEWIDVKGDVGTVGITHFAQTQIGEVVFVELPKIGVKVTAGQAFATVESVKAVFEIFSPVSGEILEANAMLEAEPEKVNSDPHGEAWFARLRLTNPEELEVLMDARTYEAFTPEGCA